MAGDVILGLELAGAFVGGALAALVGVGLGVRKMVKRTTGLSLSQASALVKMTGGRKPFTPKPLPGTSREP